MPNGTRAEATTPATDRPLNDNQIAFIERYTSTYPRNATAAYQSVYGCKASTAGVEASRLLKDPRVIAEIERRESPALGRFRLSADAIRREIAAVQHSDLSHYRITDAGEVELAPGAPPDAMKAIQSIDRTVRMIPQAGDKPAIREVRVKIRLWDKGRTLRLGTQVRGMLLRKPPEDAPPPATNEPVRIEVAFVEPASPKPATK